MKCGVDYTKHLWPVVGCIVLVFACFNFQKLFSHDVYSNRKMCGDIVFFILLPFLLSYVKQDVDNGIYLLCVSYLLLRCLSFFYHHSYCSDQGYDVFRQSPRYSIRATFTNLSSKRFLSLINKTLLEVIIVVSVYNILLRHMSKLPNIDCIPHNKKILLLVLCFIIERIPSADDIFISVITLVLSIVLLCTPLLKSKSLRVTVLIMSVLLAFFQLFVPLPEFGSVQIGKMLFIALLCMCVLMLKKEFHIRFLMLAATSGLVLWI